jgi:hypothetical protein
LTFWFLGGFWFFWTLYLHPLGGEEESENLPWLPKFLQWLSIQDQVKATRISNDDTNPI